MLRILELMQCNESIKLVFFILFDDCMGNVLLFNNANRYIKISQLFHGLLEIVFGSASVGSL